MLAREARETDVLASTRATVTGRVVDFQVTTPVVSGPLAAAPEIGGAGLSATLPPSQPTDSVRWHVVPTDDGAALVARLATHVNNSFEQTPIILLVAAWLTEQQANGVGRLLRDQARAWVQARQGAEWPDQVDEYGSVDAADLTPAADNEWGRFAVDTDRGIVEVSSEFGQAAEVAPILFGVSSGANSETGADAEMSSRLYPREVQTLADRLIERVGRQRDKAGQLVRSSQAAGRRGARACCWDSCPRNR